VVAPQALRKIEKVQNKLVQKVADRRAEVVKQQALRIGLSTTEPLDLLNAKTLDQKILASEVAQAGALAELALLEAERDWISLQSSIGEEAGATRQSNLTRRHTLVELESAVSEWTSVAERTFVSIVPQDPLDSSAKASKLRHERVKLAEETIANIARLKETIADALVITALNEDAIAEEEGPVVRILSNLWSTTSRIDSQLRHLAGTSLFKLGDTPVTAYAILRVLFVLGMAYLISYWVQLGPAQNRC
jgi:potassium efflux system protein